jgi:uncharacterized membrane protein YqjE
MFEHAPRRLPMTDTAPDAVELRGSAAQPSTRDLVTEAVEQAGRLVQKEIELAKRETAESLRAAVLALVGGAVAVFGVIAFLVMAIVTVVTAVAPHWAAALGFSVLFLAIAGGGGAFAIGRARRISPLRQTTQTIKEDVEWAKQQLTRDAR